MLLLFAKKTGYLMRVVFCHHLAWTCLKALSKRMPQVLELNVVKI